MWSFETDPEWQEQLDWARDFVVNEIEPLEFFVRSPDEMYAAFPAHADAVARSQEIADREVQADSEHQQDDADLGQLRRQ